MNPCSTSNKSSATAADHAAEVACQSIRFLTSMIDELTRSVAELQAHRRDLARQMDMVETRLARQSKLS